VSILPCNLDPVALGVVVDGYWDYDALGEHVNGCRRCKSVHSALAAMTGSRAGRAGRGAAKCRGGSDYYRALAARAKRKALR
jgi:hypothetical protein